KASPRFLMWERVFTESGSIEVSPRLGTLMFKSHVLRMAVWFSLRAIPIHLAEEARGGERVQRRDRNSASSPVFALNSWKRRGYYGMFPHHGPVFAQAPPLPSPVTLNCRWTSSTLSRIADGFLCLEAGEECPTHSRFRGRISALKMDGEKRDIRWRNKDRK
ncbi:hypothetical protein KUCAC02_037834, partial [Chaenocephalus aceratus]